MLITKLLRTYYAICLLQSCYMLITRLLYAYYNVAICLLQSCYVLITKLLYAYYEVAICLLRSCYLLITKLLANCKIAYCVALHTVWPCILCGQYKSLSFLRVLIYIKNQVNKSFALLQASSVDILP